MQISTSTTRLHVYALAYKFTGKERDNESGLDDFGARYYASTMGRFMSPDPLPWLQWQNGSSDDKKQFNQFIMNPQNLSAYTYVLNNPLVSVDPDGMQVYGPLIILGAPFIALFAMSGIGTNLLEANRMRCCALATPVSFEPQV